MVRMINRAWSERRRHTRNGSPVDDTDSLLSSDTHDWQRPPKVVKPQIPQSPTSLGRAEMHAEMERDYLNLISSLESEQRRVVDLLEARTIEKDRIQSELDRLQRELRETKSAARHMSSLEADLERYKLAVGQRDELIEARNHELDSLRKVVNLISEEKAAIEEKSKDEKERRDAFQSKKIQKLAAAVAEKDNLIKAKDEEIQSLQSHLCNRKQERDELRQEVDILKGDLDEEQYVIEDLKKTMAGYRLEIRRLKAISEEKESGDQDATKKVEEIQSKLDKKTEENKALVKEVDDLKKQVDEESNKASSLLSQIEGLKSEVERARDSIPEKVQRELSAHETKIADLEVALSKKDLDIEAKCGEIARIQADFAKSIESSACLRQTLEETKSRLEEDLERVAEARVQADRDSADKLGTLRDELAESKSQLQAQMDLVEDLQMQVNFMEGEGNDASKNHQEELRGVRKVLEETKSQLQEKSDLAHSLQEQIDDMKSKAMERDERYEKEKSVLKKELEDTKKKLQIGADQSKQLIEQMEQMEAESIEQRDAAKVEADAIIKQSYENTSRELNLIKEDNNRLNASISEKDAVIEAKDLESDAMKSMLRESEEKQEVLCSELKQVKAKLDSQDASGRTGSWRRLGSQKNLVEYESAIAEKDRCIEDKSEEVRALMTDLQKCMEERDVISRELSQLKAETEGKMNDLITAQHRADEETKHVKGELAESLEANATLKKEVSELKDQLISESKKAYKMRRETVSLSVSVSEDNNGAKASGAEQSRRENVPGIGNSPETTNLMSALEKETERKRLRMSRLRERTFTDSNQSPSVAVSRTKEVEELRELKTEEVGQLRTENEALRWEAASNNLKGGSGAWRNTPLLRDQKMSSLEESLKEMEIQLDKKSSQVDALEAQIKALEAKQNQPMSTKTDAVDSEEFIIKLDDYESRISGLKNDLAGRDSVVEAKSQEIEDLQSALERSIGEKDDLDNQVNELRARLDAETKRAAQLVDAEKSALRKVEELEARIEESEEEIANLAMGGAETQSRMNELGALKEQLEDESKRAYKLSKEVESLQMEKGKALNEIASLKDAVAERQSYIDSQTKESHPTEDTLAQIQKENDALKHEFEAITLQLKDVTARNSLLKSEVETLRKRDSDERRTYAVFRARSQPWANSNSSLSKREVRDEAESSREQSEGERRHEGQGISRQDLRNAFEAEASTETESLRKDLRDARKEKDDLVDAVRRREKYVAELEFKVSEHSKKIAELKRSMDAAGPEAFRPQSNTTLQQALALKEKEVERLHKDMVSLKMLASSKFRELESQAARAMDHEEQSQALRVALENMKESHREEIERLKSQQLRTSRPDGLKESKGIRESKMQHKYQNALKKANEEKNLLRKEVVALTAERRSFLDKIKSLEQRDASSNTVPLKMLRSENDALKREMDRLIRERKQMELEQYEF